MQPPLIPNASVPRGGRDEQQARRRQELERVFGGAIGAALADPAVVEVMVNPDGQLWVDRLLGGVEATNVVLDERDVLNTVITVAGELGAVVDDENPTLQGELPLDGSRLQAWIPPVVRRPTLNIRKHRRQGVDGVPALTLADYLAAGTIPANYVAILRSAVIERKNVIIVGGTSSGKTTFGGAYLNLISELCPDDRIITIEDTYELYCVSKHVVALRESRHVSMRKLLQQTLRARPDRIIFGEVRNEAAHDLMMAWNTGHSGGFCTIHANGVRDALSRIEQLVQLAGVPPIREAIASAVDLIVALKRGADGQRRVVELGLVNGVTDGEYELEAIAPEG
jgi:P-type conjugative transfer ATPase TrbB